MGSQLLESSIWWKGPQFLYTDYTPDNLALEPCSEERKAQATSCLSFNFQPISFNRWSNLSKIQRIFAWVLRFITNCRSRKRAKGPLCAEELTNANDKVLLCAQRSSYTREVEALKHKHTLPRGSPLYKLNPFLDDKGLLRLNLRLENAELSFESKFPIVVPSGPLANALVLSYHAILKHAGVSTLVTNVRFTYYIFGLNRIAKAICRKCIACRRHNSNPCSAPVAPLPKHRVTQAPAFSTVGLDFAGPLYCKDVLGKVYILLFTCPIVRALHLELTDSLNLPDCINAVRRFIARRGLPQVIYSDNARTFVGFSKQLTSIFGPLAPKWKFIAPLSPWWGGWWERMVRTTKNSLRKSIGTQCLSRGDLETLLIEIESCINSRPLTFASGVPEYDHPLTPAHFLIGRPPFTQIPVAEIESPITGKDLREREVAHSGLLDKFFRIWRDSYILNLPPITQGYSKNCRLKVGSLVLIRDKEGPRMTWPLGRVTRTFPGKDQIIRAVELRTSKGTVVRPIQKLHDLELNQDYTDIGDSGGDPSDLFQTDNYDAQNMSEPLVPLKGPPYRTRVGRTIQPPKFYGH